MAERTKAQQVDESGYTTRDLSTAFLAGGTLTPFERGQTLMMTYAIFKPDGTVLAHMTHPFPPTLEQMADHCAEVNGFADRDEWMQTMHIDQIAYAPVH